MNSLAEKTQHLKTTIARYGRLAVAFSGGVDSALLLAIAHDVLGGNAIAITATSPFIPQSEIVDAVAFCDTHNIPLLQIDIDPLADPCVRDNPPDRCYFCKRLIFSAIKDAASSAGFDIVADGTNADDVSDYRPGMRALEELGIVSPLKDAGLAKEDIRELSRQMGLATAEKPSMACLASRIPYGDAIEEGALARIEAAEEFLGRIGFSPVRVRDHAGVARIEVDENDILRIASDGVREDVESCLRGLGFDYVSVDLGGFASGKMNVRLGRG